MPFKYSLVCDTLKFVGHDVAKEPGAILAAVKDAGYDGCDLPCDPGRVSAAAFRPIVDALGLHVPAVQGAWGYTHAGESRDLAGADRAARRRGIEYARQAIDLAAELGAQLFQVCATQPGVPQSLFPELPIATLRRNLIESLRELCEYAGERGITILLEPVNAYEAYPGVLTTVYEAIGLIRELGVGNVGIQPDIFHMNIMEGSLPAALRAGGPLVRHVHINETNHYSLGTGHADFDAILGALMEIGFAGYLATYMPLVSQEVFQMASVGYGGSQSQGGADAADRPELGGYLEHTIGYLKHVEQNLEMQRRCYETEPDGPDQT